ncbi:NERD domain-containing protein [Aquibacillus sp. 3ASR75-11]|uniref:NERD domain-containing protein n=1 Tax=Terrihalobacillus insolitus TaxID=2950438 RepID=A0A9X4AN66_9BACI|nr:NERD domain-containing protein [Terrihalobacillus insolitus]MDC3415089.1 NERD domain-containing protein [Terrihalobacillus insolitus]MDC3426086.1 NERD domain-containing protein [Terrihalobacillus insolitus]
MAQVVKIKDYISRYETNIYHYPGQFIRLKKENWNKALEAWELQDVHEMELEHTNKKETILSKWKRLFTKVEEKPPAFEEQVLHKLPESKQQLKHEFLDTLMRFQLKWASTTVSDMSIVDQGYEDDQSLKYFLQRFPDTYLLYYYPIFNLKNAPIEAEILFVSPIGMDIIHLIDFNSKEIEIMADDGRTWNLKEGNEMNRMLSPMISLKRTEQVIKRVLNTHHLDFPITKVVLSPNHRLRFQAEPFRTKFIGLEQHDEWLSEKRGLVSPLKHQQLKVCEVLLKYCQTSAVKRPEWEDETYPL